ncbi:EpsG family protein [Prevotella sp. P6B1]|uniref:EpsG family protein n=1 Tax=Prevotella sp. P6B1 TaxID=1410613 RepID=UPI00051B4E8B|nr:EpsG family protein [Prevotella sp. P6B1]
MGMIPYYFMLAIILICAWAFSPKMSSKKQKWLLVVALLPVFCLLSFRSESVGADTASYTSLYLNMADLGSVDKTSRIEFGFQLFSIVLYKCFGSTQALFIFSSLIVCVSLFIFIKRTATNHSLALYFFVTMGFFQFALSGIRQTLSISILLYTLPFIQNKKLIPYFAIVILAYLFHKSALLFLPMYWIMNLRVTKLNMLLAFGIMLGALIFAEPLLLTAADALNYDYGIESTGNGILFMLVVLIISVLCLKNRLVIINKKATNVLLLNANYVSLTLWVVRLVSRTVERVSLYYMPFTYVALEQYISTRSNNNRWSFVLVAVLLATFLFVHRISPSEALNNFTFYWQ